MRTAILILCVLFSLGLSAQALQGTGDVSGKDLEKSVAGGMKAKRVKAKPGDLINVEREEVPAGIISAFESRFAEASSSRWQHFIEKGKAPGRYIVHFKNEGLDCFAKYAEDGTGKVMVVVHDVTNLPPDMAAIMKEIGLTPSKCAEIHSLESDVVVYKLRARRGTSVENVYINDDGKQIKERDLPEMLEEVAEDI